MFEHSSQQTSSALPHAKQRGRTVLSAWQTLSNQNICESNV